LISPWVVGLSHAEGDPQPASNTRSLPRPHSPSSRRLPFEGIPDCSLPYPSATEAAYVSGSSLGVPQRPPFHRCHPVCPLSVSRGSGLPHPNAFRPCCSSQLRRLAPHLASRVCCTPLPVVGFAWFHADRRLSPTPDAPPASFPSRSPFSRAAGFPSPGPCPLVVGPEDRSLLSLHLEAFLRSRASRDECRHPPRTDSLGFPRPRPSPEHPVARGSCWFPSCPVRMLASGFPPVQRPLYSARAPSHPHAVACRSWHPRREPDFSRSPVISMDCSTP
jgi:hypothetical protein